MRGAKLQYILGLPSRVDNNLNPPVNAVWCQKGNQAIYMYVQKRRVASMDYEPTVYETMVLIIHIEYDRIHHITMQSASLENL